MKKGKRLRLLLLLILCIPSLAVAQEPEPLGDSEASSLPSLWFEFDAGVPLDVERTVGVYNWCPSCSGAGRSFNGRIRVGGAFEVGRWSGNLGFYGSRGYFDSDPYTQQLTNPATQETIPIEEAFRVSTLSGGIGADLSYPLLRILPALRLEGGAWGDFRLLSHTIQSRTLISPGDVSYVENGQRNVLVAEGEILADNPFSFGPILSLTSRLSISRSLAIDPSLVARLDVGALLDGIGLRSITPGIALRLIPLRSWQRGLPLSPSIPPEPPANPPTPNLPRLEVAIDLYVVDADGEKREEGELVTWRTLYLEHGEVLQERVVDRYMLPPIGLDTTIRADRGIAWWGISIRRGDEEIARLTSDDPERPLSLSFSFDDRREGEIPLQAEMMVEDEDGRMAAARDRLSFRPGEREKGEEESLLFDQIEDRWSLEPLPLQKEKRTEWLSRQRTSLQEGLDSLQRHDGSQMLLLFPAGNRSEEANGDLQDDLVSLLRSELKRLSPSIDLATIESVPDDRVSVITLVVARQP